MGLITEAVMNLGDYLDTAADWAKRNKGKIVLVAAGAVGALVLVTVF